MKYQNNRCIFQIFIIVLCTFIFSSCSLFNSDQDFQESICNEPCLNSEVMIYDPPGWNSYLIGEPISIMVENIGIEKVLFPEDYGVRVFSKNDGSWDELVLIPTFYYGGEIILIPSDNTPRYIGSLMVIPIIDKKEKILIRIVVKGNQYIDERITNKEVVAYTDIVLYPE